MPNNGSEKRIFEEAPAEAFRIVPLLRVDSSVVVDRVFVSVNPDRVSVSPPVEVPSVDGSPQEVAALVAKSVAGSSRNAST